MASSWCRPGALHGSSTAMRRRPRAGQGAPAQRDPLGHTRRDHHAGRVARDAAHAPEVGGQRPPQLRCAARVAVVEAGGGRVAQRPAERGEPARAGEERDVGRARAEVEARGALRGWDRGGVERRQRRVGDPRRRALARRQVALGHELLVGLDHHAAGDAEIARQGPRGRELVARREPAAAHGRAQLVLELPPQRARVAVDLQQHLACARRNWSCVLPHDWLLAAVQRQRSVVERARLLDPRAVRGQRARARHGAGAEPPLHRRPGRRPGQPRRRRLGARGRDRHAHPCRGGRGRAVRRAGLLRGSVLDCQVRGRRLPALPRLEGAHHARDRGAADAPRTSPERSRVRAPRLHRRAAREPAEPQGRAVLPRPAAPVRRPRGRPRLDAVPGARGDPRGDRPGRRPDLRRRGGPRRRATPGELGLRTLAALDHGGVYAALAVVALIGGRRPS